MAPQHSEGVKRAATASLGAAVLVAALVGCHGPLEATVPAKIAGTARHPDTIPDESRIDGELLVRRIARDTYVVVHEPFFASNVLVARMANGSVVICSSPFHDEATRALVKWVHETLRPTRIVAINTHFHLDGSAGNQAYEQLGVTTYASALTQRLLRERGATLPAATAAMLTRPEQRRRVQRVKLQQANRTFSESEGLVLKMGAEEVRVIFPGAAHSPDNVLVHFPARGLLFGGCMIKASREVGYIGDADLSHWPAALETARGLAPRIVVPGHGPIGGPELFDVTISAVRDARHPRATR